MKFTFALTLLLPLVLAAVPKKAPWYTISTRSTNNTFDNLFIFTKNGLVWAADSNRIAAAWRGGSFFTTQYNGTKTLSLHPGNETHQLGLQYQIGNKGVLTLVDLPEPRADKIAKETPTEWSVFEIGQSNGLGQSGELTVKDGQNITTRKWIAWSDDDTKYTIGLWDGITPQPRSFGNITLFATSA